MKRKALFHPRVFSDPAWAASYHRRNVDFIQKTAKRLANLLERSGFNEGDVLDAGCGFGAVSLELARRFPRARVHGVDLAEPLLDMARVEARRESLASRVVLSPGDVEDLDFPDDSFDLSISSFMLHIVERPTRMLDELERVTRTGGIILVTDLRRGLSGLFNRKIRTALTAREAVELIDRSTLRPGKLTRGWRVFDYLAGL